MRRGIMLLACVAAIAGGCSLLTLKPGQGAPPRPSTGDLWNDYGVQAVSDLILIGVIVGHRYLFHKRDGIAKGK